MLHSSFRFTPPSTHHPLTCALPSSTIHYTSRSSATLDPLPPSRHSCYIKRGRTHWSSEQSLASCIRILFVDDCFHSIPFPLSLFHRTRARSSGSPRWAGLGLSVCPLASSWKRSIAHLGSKALCIPLQSFERAQFLLKSRKKASLLSVSASCPFFSFFFFFFHNFLTSYKE